LRGFPSVERTNDGRPPLGQRTRILTQLFGFDGWRVAEAYFEAPDGAWVVPVGTYLPPPEVRLVVRMQRRWLACFRDPSGRVRSEERDGFTRTYDWNAQGRIARLTKSTADATVTTLHGYDYAGQRREKLVDGTKFTKYTKYTWALGELVEESSGPGAATVYGGVGGEALTAGENQVLHDALGSCDSRPSRAGRVQLQPAGNDRGIGI
jgi:YD repeat-containing protein